jgi:PKD repeat protein
MELYPASSYVEELHEIDFAIETKMSTGKSYLRPDEAVAFKFKPTTSQTISYTVEFGDGNTLTTMNDYIEHVYKKVGEFEVTVTAKARKATKEMKIKVKVIDKEEGAGPEVVRLSASQSKSKEMTLLICISTFGLQPLKCVVDFGDKTDAESFGATDTTTPLFKKSFEHKYPRPGFYDIQLNCSNNHSFKLYKTVVAVRDSKLHKMIRSETSMLISVETRNGKNTIDMMERGRKLSYKGKTVMLSLGMANFPSSQDYFVEVVSGKVTLLKYIVKRLRTISGTLTPGKKFGHIADTFDFTNQVKGDLAFGRTGYGGGKVVNYYMPHPQQPTGLKHAYNYGKLGYYPVATRLCNRLGCRDFSTSASVENTIKKVATMASDINIPGEVRFTFRVNPTTSVLVDRVKATLGFGDGQTQSLILLNPTEKARDLYVFHKYEDYGMFKMAAVMSNNVSTFSVSTYAQVGQNLTYVDIFVEHRRQEVLGEVTFLLIAPTGSTPIYELDFGEKDGKVLTISEGPQQDTLPRVVMHTPGNVSVTHSYAVKGQYTVKVKVSNKFGSVNNSICPPIIIVDKPTALLESYCTPPEVKFHGFSESDTLLKPMSENITVSVNTTVKCQMNDSATYTWKWYRILRVNGTTIERPLKTPCVTQHHNATLYLKPLTLTYGLYRAEVCVGLAINEMKFTCKSFKVQIQTSPLRARIPELNFVQEQELMHINVTGSGDPDIKVRSNDYSLLNVICFRRDDDNPMKQEDLDEFMKKEKPSVYGPRIRLYDYMDHCFTEQMVFTQKGLCLTANSTYLSTNATYVVRLIVAKGSRRAIRDQTIKIIEKIVVEDIDISELASRLDDIKDIGEKSAVIFNVADQLNRQAVSVVLST